MSLIQLESIVTVAKKGTVRASARALNVSQSPLTRRIKALEEELGIRIFLRGAAGMSLRPEVIGLMERAERILNKVQELVSLANQLGK